MVVACACERIRDDHVWVSLDVLHIFCDTESRVACAIDETVSGYAAAVDADDPTKKRKIGIRLLIAVAQKAFNGTSVRSFWPHQIR